jgi:hypothetical protein
MTLQLVTTAFVRKREVPAGLCQNAGALIGLFSE